ncbi:MAG: NADH-quinone oxidoreductase subunit M [Candidatus Bathyarchaeota archaeon]|nr:NADH-quinone oxidoreductase subunit M [Candidatus Bathyarchaeum sp.]
METLLIALMLPALAIPVVYGIGKKSAKTAALILTLIVLVSLSLLLTLVPTVLSEGQYIESYYWIPTLGSAFTLFVDGISLSLAIATLILVSATTVYSINYMEEKSSLPEYFALMSLLTIGLIGVFITSNLLLFYFCWELMLVPTYFIIGGWGYKDSFKTAFKFFIFTHAGAIFVLLGIGAIYMLTGTLDIFEAQAILATTVDQSILPWVLISFVAGFAVKMAIVPLHMWLPDAHGESPAPMSALLSGVIIGAGGYAVLRIALGTVYTAMVPAGNEFLLVLSFFGVLSAFYGSFLALAETDIKRIIAYSSISHMGYVLFALSLFPSSEGITGAVLHLVNHTASKGLLFLTAGAVMHQTGLRNINDMGGLASKMPLTAIATAIAAFSIGGIPPFACFISEFHIFVGAVTAAGADSSYYLPTILMLIATVFSLAYVLRYFWKVFLGSPKAKTDVEPVTTDETGEQKTKNNDPSMFMLIAMLALAAFVVILGIYPGVFIDLIHAVTSII